MKTNGLLLVAAVAGVCAKTAAGFDVFPICTNAADQTYPAIDQRTVVWSDQRNGQWDIYRYDLDSKQETLVFSNSNRKTYPQVSGGTVVWQELSPNSFDIMGYSLSTNTPLTICARENSHQEQPAISGDLVAWEDTRDAGQNYQKVYFKRLGWPGDSWVPCDSTFDYQRNPRIDGDRITYEDSRGPGSGIRVYQTPSGTETVVIQSQTYLPHNPDISGNIVVFEYGAWDAPDIYACDLRDMHVFPICTAPGDQERPRIDGNLIVWQDGRNAPAWGIYAFDLTTGTEFPVCTQGIPGMPDISGNTVVWIDCPNWPNGNTDIYGTVIPEPAALSLLGLGGLALIRRRSPWAGQNGIASPSGGESGGGSTGVGSRR